MLVPLHVETDDHDAFEHHMKKFLNDGVSPTSHDHGRSHHHIARKTRQPLASLPLAKQRRGFLPLAKQRRETPEPLAALSRTKQSFEPARRKLVETDPNVQKLPQHIKTHVLALFHAFADSVSRPSLPLRNTATRDEQSTPTPQDDGLTRTVSLNRLPPRRKSAPLVLGATLPPLDSTRARRRPATSTPQSSHSALLAPSPSTPSLQTFNGELCFEAILRSYYRSSSPSEIRAMISLVEPAAAAVQRRRWVKGAKERHAEQIRMAFLMGDANGDGELSLSEFAEAISIHTGAKFAIMHGLSDHASGAMETGDKAAPAMSAEELSQIFDAADADGSGTLDLDEFLQLVSSHPKLMACFEDVLGAGVKRRLRKEESRLSAMFRSAPSPTSRGVASPSGRKRRPSLLDLKRAGDVQLPLPAASA